MKRIIRNTLAFSCVITLFISCSEEKTDKNLDSFKTLDSLKIKDSLMASTPDKEKQFTQMGLDLMKNESFGNIKLSLGLTDIREYIGEPEDKSSLDMWGSDGNYHQDWNYNKMGLVLNIIGQVDSGKVINTMTISGLSGLKTKRLIGIGSTMEDVQAAYKESINPSSSNADMMVAGTIYGGIIFNMENKKVKSIIIGASAE